MCVYISASCYVYIRCLLIIERQKMEEANNGQESNEFRAKDPAVEIERMRSMTESRDRAFSTRSRSKSVHSDVNDKGPQQAQVKHASRSKYC